jgi:hypothetical protein
MIGMHHGDAAVEPVDLSADHDRLVDGQGFFEPVALRAEEHQRHLTGIVLQEDTVRHVGIASRRRLVTVDAGGDRDDGALLRIGDARLLAPVDDTGRRMKDEIDDPAILDRLAAEQPRIEFARLGPDAGQRRE